VHPGRVGGAHDESDRRVAGSAARAGHPPHQTSADTIAAVVKEYETEIAKLEVEIARPRRAVPDKAKLEG